MENKEVEDFKQCKTEKQQWNLSQNIGIECEGLC